MRGKRLMLWIWLGVCLVGAAGIYALRHRTLTPAPGVYNSDQITYLKPDGMRPGLGPPGTPHLVPLPAHSGVHFSTNPRGMVLSHGWTTSTQAEPGLSVNLARERGHRPQAALALSLGLYGVGYDWSVSIPYWPLIAGLLVLSLYPILRLFVLRPPRGPEAQ